MADSEWWEVGTWKETKSGKNFFIKLGGAKAAEDGGFTCYLDALPLPGPKGGCMLVIKPQRPRGEYGQRQQAAPDADTDIPF